MGDHSERWPPPESPEAFENLCLDLWSEIWGDPGAQKNGRSGQRQAGVDVYGRHNGQWVGVQCKKKDGLLRTQVTVRELEAEFKAAFVGKPKSPPFDPPLARFILATTGPRDAAVQKRARQLGKPDVEVEVWGWEDIWHELYRRPELLARIKPVYWPRLSALGEPKVATSRLPRGAPKLFGREAELDRLEATWQDEKIGIVTIVGWGGAGKSALVGEWVAGLAGRDFEGADYFDWSFYSQGTRDHNTASADTFVDAALRFFDDPATADSTQGAWEKGSRLAKLIGRRRALLVLDGLEPLQHPPGPLAGELRDPAIKALFRGLVTKNPGLCVVTTRVSVVELASHRAGAAPEWLLDRLPPVAGVRLLRSLGVDGSRAELEAAVEEVGGHALTLSLIGRFLAKAHGGDVKKRDRVKLYKVAQKIQGKDHAFGAIAAYDRWLAAGDADNQRQLAILRLLGLFDRPAADGLLAALRAEPMIEGLTEDLMGLGEEDWNLLVSHLAEAHLLAKIPGALDAHPLIREYFGQQLREQNADAWRAANGRLFDHLKGSTEHRPATLVGLQPLYQAVYHGCQAGRQREACDEVYSARISRGKESFVVRKLGAFGADLGAVACFFETPWNRVSPSLTEILQAWLLNQAAVRLRALGRLQEAVEPMRLSLDSWIRKGEWEYGAGVASNLSELELTLGKVKVAVELAEQAVDLADRSGDSFERMVNRTALADAQHQAGEIAAALALFRDAERLQVERQPRILLLYSLRGYQYCDLLLAQIEHAARSGRGGRGPKAKEVCTEVELRATQALRIGERNDSLLDVALAHLTLGRARLYRAVVVGRTSRLMDAAETEIEMAVAGLHAAGTIHHIPRGLLTRAWHRHIDGDSDAARADLDEAHEIAKRGSMKLHLADIALYRAQLFYDREALAEAKRLVEECGYGRRRPEIADLEARLGSGRQEGAVS